MYSVLTAVTAEIEVPEETNLDGVKPPQRPIYETCGRSIGKWGKGSATFTE